MLRLFWFALSAYISVILGSSLEAQTLRPPPTVGPAPLWLGNYPGDPGAWPTPEAACKAQHDYYNPNATLEPPTYNGGLWASCNWKTNPNSNTILSALAKEYCPAGWIWGDPGVCFRNDDIATDSRAQCNCLSAGPAGTPQPAIGDPIALNHGALTEHEVDYASADGRFSVERDYYSLGEDYSNTFSPTQIPGFGGHWHGLVPGRLAITGRQQVEYLDVQSGFSHFKLVDFYDTSNWNWGTFAATHQRLSMVSIPSGSRDDYFYNQPSVVNGPAEVRLDMAQGEYLLFRRSGMPSGLRYLVPVEHGYADGYKIFYTYPDIGENPSKISDSLGRQMTLTWINANRLTYASLDISKPVKVIGAIILPDGTSLRYRYGTATDVFGAQIQDRLEGVSHLSQSNAVLWGRSYLYENSVVPYGLTGKLDQAGSRLSTYTYDAAGLVASTERAGAVEKYTVVNLEEKERTNFWRRVTNPLGHRTDYVFTKVKNYTDSQRTLTRVNEYQDTGVAAASLSYQYDGYVGDMVINNVTDQRGLVRRFSVDGQLRPIQTVEAAGTLDARTTNSSWLPNLDLPSHEERAGLSTDYTYSTTGLLLTKTETDTATQTTPYATAGQKRIWTYSWNGNGRLLSINGPKGRDVNGNDDVTTFTYDTSGNLLMSTDAIGHATRFFNYDLNGRPGKMTDLNGIDTLFFYDLLGRVNSIVVKDPMNASGDANTTFTYDLEGRVTSITLPSGTTPLIINYDLAGRVTAVRVSGAETIAYTYDAMNDIIAETTTRSNNTIARQIRRTFDGLGRILTSTLGAGRTTSWSYDAVGNATATTGARSNATVNGFDGLNRLVSAIAPDTGRSVTTYDVRDNPTSFTDPRSITTTFIRNGFGDIISEISPDRGTSTYYYDAAGDRTAEVDGRGQRVDIVRDALGRVLSKTPVGRPASEIITYMYDTGGAAGSYGVGRLAKVVDGLDQITFGYDHRGNLLLKSTLFNTGERFDLRYGYDLADRIVSVTYPSGRVVRYVRNSRGQVTSVTTRPTATGADTLLASGITYEAFGSLTGATFSNGLTLTQSWGNDGRLTSKRLYKTAAGTNLSSLAYTYDNDDNVTTISDSVDPTRSVTYGYDSVNRLTQSVWASGSVRRQDFVLDVTGNRLRVEQRTNPGDATPVSIATYGLTNGTNRLASMTDPTGTRAISYDARGNTISETRPGSVAVSAGYDGYGRLTSYTNSGSSSFTNGYNGLDDRVTVSTTTGSTTDVRRFVYDADGRLTGEYGTSASIVKAETIWLSPEVVGTGQPFGGDDGVRGYAPLALVAGSTLYWVHGNHLGVPVTTTNSAGNLASPTGYTPVGFPGQMRTLADLYYNRYRDYDPLTGRYIQADPIGLRGGTNLYVYAANNPIRWTDPWGLAPGDKWYGYNDKTFQRWYHRCIKQPGDPDATKEEIAEYYQEWLAAGKPGPDSCRNTPPEPNPAPQPQHQPDENPPCGKDCKNKVATVVIGAAGAYIVYRCIRMLPSLIPPLWPTIPLNAAVP